MHIQVWTSDGRSINYRIKSLVENTHVTRVSIRSVNITVDVTNIVPEKKAPKPKQSRIRRFRVIRRCWMQPKHKGRKGSTGQAKT